MNVKDILDAPWRPDLGGYAHVYPGNWTRLLFAYDAIADAGYLTDEDKADIDAALVLGAHVLAHPDYWNPARGLCSANPNMTALITLPRGLMALYLDGHPRADRWLKSAEDELQAELKAWIAPGGAWIECPGYQGASLDPMLPLMQALKNVKGRNYFADPRFKATMDYYGFLLTPPDRRFPPNNTAGLPSPRILPSLGDMWTGATTVFTGWTAKAIADADPVFGARQQYHWQQQLMPHGTMYSSGYTPALTNPELPAAPPVELSRAFPGMGSVMRSSWTDPNASYLLHRTGEFMHHYHDDFNSLIYYAKGAPLCADFGNLYQPHQRGEAWYHSRVSFNAKDNPPSQANQSTGRLVETCFLPRTLDYSHGQSAGVGKQTANRHLLLVKSADPMGATYVVMRDATTDGPNEREFYWNLWCLSKEPQIAGNVVRFPGQLGVGLDVHLLSPATPKLEIDKWDWKQYIGTWGNFTEEQYGLHVHKTGSAEDYVAVLYPRSAGQGPARVRAEASVVNARGNAQVLTITHMEGEDTILFSPQADALHFGKAELAGRIAFVRRYQNGALRLATVSGKCAVTLDEWSLHSDGPTAIEIIGKQVTGESNGAAHAAQIVLPAATGAVTATLDGKRIRVKREKNVVSLNLPAGAHTFTLAVK
ncbi:MAG: hypothetical protein BWY76_03010 [bacterium ADurb.Bin429]|nr:MAG: hypothetical protein BWY76_03010 [bacterium ADurb.Bin429]